MEQRSSTARSFVISYMGLRKAIGVVGLTLPFVLAFGKVFIDGPGIEFSISSYYYSSMRDVFVGAMCSIGIFLFSYRGYERKDDIAGNLACFFAIGLALVPTAPDNSDVPRELFIGYFHLAFAAGFFLTLAYFSLFLFTKTNPDKSPTGQKVQRNRVYRVCGALIVISLLLIVVCKQLQPDAPVMRLEPIFWLESVAVISFGISWLVKGEVIFKDSAKGMTGQSEAHLS